MVDFKLKPNTMVINLSMDECIDYIFQNKDLICRKAKNTSNIEQIRSAIFSTQNMHEINRMAAYGWLYDNFLKNTELPPVPTVDITEYKKEVIEELKKNFTNGKTKQ